MVNESTGPCMRTEVYGVKQKPGNPTNNSNSNSNNNNNNNNNTNNNRHVKTSDMMLNFRRLGDPMMSLSRSWKLLREFMKDVKYSKFA